LPVSLSIPKFARGHGQGVANFGIGDTGRVHYRAKAALQSPHHPRISELDMRKILTLVLILGGIAVAAPAAHAQASAPYDRDLQRLAEILGSLHYLRPLCGANEGAKWRNEMQALVDAETPSGERRDKLVAGFNRGFRGFQQTYRTCTPAAEIVIRRYLEEGAKISRDITARYAN
jgi:uncharacterized protein (TIGR02301 family)